MNDTILATLDRIEREHNIRILYAVESGSRAWGFGSQDSDYDVRYIFIRKREDYIGLEPLSDTIEGPLDDTLDFSGWDIRKALVLLRKSNPSLMEWLHSPIVYRTTPDWEQLRIRFGSYFNPYLNMQHYFSMFANNLKKLAHEDQAKIKTYLYTLRPLLCCLWLEKFRTMPPVLFRELCQEVLPPELRDTVAELLRQKQTACETAYTPRIPQLDNLFHQELSRLQEVRHIIEQKPLPDLEPLNGIFFRLLQSPESNPVSGSHVYIAPSAHVSGDVVLGENVNIWHGAVVRGDNGRIVIGEGTNIQDHAIVHDPTTIGKHCTIGHGAIVHGAVIGDHCLIGMGAIILNGAILEADCLVGAGALVTGKIHAPAGSLLLGNPAKVVNEISPGQRQNSRENAAHYVLLAKEAFGS